MNFRFVTQLAPFVAGFVAWMLSGSPVPMALSLVLLTIAFGGSRLTRTETARRFLRLLFPFLALAAAISQLWLFRTGLAMALSAELPLSFHLGIAFLWAVAMEATMNRYDQGKCSGPILPLLGIVGSLTVFSSALATELYDFGAWQVLPLAALPSVLFFFTSVFEKDNRWKLVLASIASALGLTAFAINLDRGTNQISTWIYRDDSRLEDLSDNDRPRFDSGTGGLDGSSRRLPRKADIRFDDRIRLFLKTESSELFRSWMREPLYLRTSTVTVFENDEVIAPIRSGRWIYDIDDGDTDNTIPISHTQPSLVHDYTLFIENTGANALPLLVGSRRVNATALYEFADDWYQLAPGEATKRLRYTCSIDTIEPSFLTKLPPGGLQRPDGPGIYLNMPPSPLAARVTHLCESLKAENPARAIREHLQSRASYSLTYETPDHMSPVESLLFGERRGHCELYAAASVLMLRSLNIPCRLAYGYTGGMADRNQKVIAFRDRDFHAWAEILSPDNRWIVYDTTPVTENATRRIPAKTTFAAADWNSYENFSSGETAFAGSSFSLLPGLIEVTAFLSRHFLTITLMGLVLFGLGWWGRNSLRSRIADLPSSSPSPTVEEFALPLIQELETCGKQVGVTRQPGQTWKEFLDQIRKMEALPTCFSAAVDYYYRVRYAQIVSDPNQEAKIRKKLANWRVRNAEGNGI